jgi:hypothetical protein
MSKMRFIMTTSGVALGAASLFGCAVANHGKTSYFKAPIEYQQRQKVTDAAEPGPDSPDWTPPTAQLNAGASHIWTREPAPANASEKYLRPLYGQNQVVSPYRLRAHPSARTHPSIRLQLRQGFIKQFTEAGGQGAWGEVGILANVREAGGGSTGTQISDDGPGRVVYFSEGVREGAYLNFDSMPVYGPIDYRGGDLSIHLTIIESDEKDNARLNSTLETLAAVGGTAYPPSSPILLLLESIGKTFTSSNGDDTEFDFRMTLTNKPDNINNATAYLEDAFLIFIRQEPLERLYDADDFSRIRFDVRTNRLKKLILADSNSGAASHWVDFEDATYLVLAVESGLDPSKNNTLESIESLNNRIKDTVESGSFSTQDLDALKAKVQEVQSQFNGAPR